MCPRCWFSRKLGDWASLSEGGAAETATRCGPKAVFTRSAEEPRCSDEACYHTPRIRSQRDRRCFTPLTSPSGGSSWPTHLTPPQRPPRPDRVPAGARSSRAARRAGKLATAAGVAAAAPLAELLGRTDLSPPRTPHQPPPPPFPICLRSRRSRSSAQPDYHYPGVVGTTPQDSGPPDFPQTSDTPGGAPKSC